VRWIKTVRISYCAGGRQQKLVVAYPDELVSEAAAKLLRYDVGRLPVVDRADERKVVGYLGRSTILAARLAALSRQHVREPGWWSRGRAPG